MNFIPLLRSLKKDFARWNKSLLSWFGRFNALKMNSLPLLYLLQALPVPLPPSFLKKICSACIAFVWEDKPPRNLYENVSKTEVQLAVGLPDSELYHLVVHLARVAD